MILVRNIKHGHTSGVYVGRDMPGWPGSPLANPFRADEHGRLGALDLYRSWLAGKILQDDPEILAELRRLKTLAVQGDLTLLCWCSPWTCHAEVIQAALEVLPVSS